MTVMPVHNAHVSQIAAPGASERYDRPAGAGPVKWSGDAEAFLNETREERPRSDGGLDIFHHSILVVPANLTTVDPGDLVTYTPTDGTLTTRKTEDVDDLSWQGVLNLHFWDR